MSGKREKKRMKTRDKILILLGLFLLAFILTMIVTFWVKGAVPDTLISCVLDAGRWEAAILAIITVCKYLTGDKPGESEGEHEKEDS